VLSHLSSDEEYYTADEEGHTSGFALQINDICDMVLHHQLRSSLSCQAIKPLILSEELWLIISKDSEV